MTAGRFTIVLHTHLPYCRLAGRWPHGEEWLHEALVECYLPLLGAFRRLAAERLDAEPLGVTMNLTPILVEQLADPTVNAHFVEYLAVREAAAASDVERWTGTDDARLAAAHFHRERYATTARLYRDELGGDVIGGFRALQDAGAIEIATSAATHGFLPLLESEAAVRFQVETGVRAYERHFGRRPRSFWLPECAYTPGLEKVLANEGLRVFFVETHLITGGVPRGRAAGDALGPYALPSPEPLHEVSGHGTTFRPYATGRSNVAVFGRNERLGVQVWSAAQGYPGDGAYREFHRKDDLSGLHYWRVTGPEADLGEKAIYDPGASAQVAEGHAAHFAGLVRSELEAYQASAGETGHVLAAYDTELFGHWWLEGVPFLESVLRLLAADREIERVAAGEAVVSSPPRDAIDLQRGSWGNGGDERTWMNEATAWTWAELRRRQEVAGTLLRANTPATRQLARELLLLQSSDWQFLITTGQAATYATERFQSHCERFDRLAAVIGGDDGVAADALALELEALDNPFPDIDPLRYGAVPAAEPR